MTGLENRIYLGNITGIVESRATLTVIDPGYRKSMVKKIGDLSASTGKDVGQLIFTHMHSDHVHNASSFPKVTRFSPSCFEAEESSIDLDNVKYDIYKTPGHTTSGDISVLVKGVVFVGDLVNRVHIPLICDADSYLASLDRIAGLDFKYMFSAHGGLLTREEGLEAVRKMSFYVGHAKQLLSERVNPDKKAICEIYNVLLTEAGFTPEQILDKQTKKDSNDRTHFSYFVSMFKNILRATPERV